MTIQVHILIMVTAWHLVIAWHMYELSQLKLR